MRNPSASASTYKTPCCSKVGIKRGPWTPEEDELLANYVKREGEGRWRTMPKRAGLLRCGKSCRLRWMNYLRPSVKRGRIAPDEEDLILRLHRLLGNRWSLIAGRIPGRTDNEIKNYWNTHLSKKLISQGIDPRTHKPLKPNPSPSTIEHDPAPKLNPNHNFSRLEETGGSSRVVGNQSGENIKVIDQDQHQNLIFNDSYGNWHNCDGLRMGLQSHEYNNEDNIIDICNEETFSSFLDSLINDNMFSNQQQQPNLIAPSVNPLVSSVQTFNHGTLWGAEVVSTMAAALSHEQNMYPG